jgi:hypothetical protein
MSDKELKKKIEAIRRLRKEVCVSKEAARDFLVKAGICTKSGKLAKAYR